MAVSVSTAGPYFSSGEIKFSDLRKYFRSQVRKTTSEGSETFSPDPSTDTTAISAAELLRVTDTTVENPVVPDSTENNDIATTNDLKLSQFRDSIKYYYVTLPSSDEVINFDIDSQDWNTNLGKNINKFMFIDGTCGSNVTSSPAATFDATTYNLTIDVFGIIYGAGGRGGGTAGAPSISGENGGDALSVTSSGGNNVVVNVKSGAKIYGGGGGGEKGATGNKGADGKCVNYSYQFHYNCGSCPGCPSGTSTVYCYERQGKCHPWKQTREQKCQKTKNNDVSGGAGGAGGNGRQGRGYNNQSGAITPGIAGIDGIGGGCGGYDANGSPVPQKGLKGETGGKGGNWAGSGGNTDNTGSGGNAGKAITGSNYTVTGSTGLDTIKGLFTAL